MPEWGVPHKARGPSLRPGKGRVCRARDLGLFPGASWSLRLSKGRAGWLASQPSPALVRTQQPRPPSKPSSFSLPTALQIHALIIVIVYIYVNVYTYSYIPNHNLISP